MLRRVLIGVNALLFCAVAAVMLFRFTATGDDAVFVPERDLPSNVLDAAAPAALEQTRPEPKTAQDTPSRTSDPLDRSGPDHSEKETEQTVPGVLEKLADEISGFAGKDAWSLESEALREKLAGLLEQAFGPDWPAKLAASLKEWCGTHEEHFILYLMARLKRPEAIQQALANLHEKGAGHFYALHYLMNVADEDVAKGLRSLLEGPFFGLEQGRFTYQAEQMVMIMDRGSRDMASRYLFSAFETAGTVEKKKWFLRQYSHIPQKGHAYPIVGALERETDPEVRKLLVFTLACMETEGSREVDLLVEHLGRETDPEVRKYTMKMIADKAPAGFCMGMGGGVGYTSGRNRDEKYLPGAVRRDVLHAIRDATCGWSFTGRIPGRMDHETGWHARVIDPLERVMRTDPVGDVKVAAVGRLLEIAKNLQGLEGEEDTPAMIARRVSAAIAAEKDVKLLAEMEKAVATSKEEDD